MSKNTTVHISAFSSTQSGSKSSSLPNEPRRVVSKILRQLHSTRAVRRMLRDINWCILCVVMCAFVANRTDFSSCSMTATVGKQQKRTRRSHRRPSSWTTLGSLALRWHRSCRPWRQTCPCYFLRLLLLIVRRNKARSGHTAVRVCATFKAHTKKNQDIQKTFAQRQGTC